MIKDKNAGSYFDINTLNIPNFFKEYLKKQISNHNGKTRTAENYYYQLKHYLSYVHKLYIGGEITQEALFDVDYSEMTTHELGVLTVKDVSTYIDFCQEIGLNPSSIKLRYSAMNSLYNYLIDIEEDPNIEKNPMRKIKLDKLEKEDPVYLTKDECESLLRTAFEKPNNERTYCILTLFINLGLRVHELVGIDIPDFMKENGEFNDEHNLPIIGKGSHKRTEYLNEACRTAILSWLKVRQQMIDHLDIDSEKNPKHKEKNDALKAKAKKETALFITRDFDRITIRRVQQLVMESYAAAGIAKPGLSTHKLRHTCATLFYQEQGTDLIQLKTLLGHKSTITTEVYTHLGDKALQQTMEESPLSTFDPSK